MTVEEIIVDIRRITLGNLDGIPDVPDPYQEGLDPVSNITL